MKLKKKPHKYVRNNYSNLLSLTFFGTKKITAGNLPGCLRRLGTVSGWGLILFLKRFNQ